MTDPENVRNTSVENYETCRECGAGLDRQIPGGPADWSNIVLCGKCMNEREASDEVIAALQKKKVAQDAFRYTGEPRESLREREE